LQRFIFRPCLCLLALWCSPAWAQAFETRLAPSPASEGTRGNVAGEGRARATLDGNRLTVGGEFHGLVTPGTTAALYDGIRIGAMGPKLADITVTPGQAGTISGDVTLSAKQAAELRAGHIYVRIDSEKAPDGNLTGWLMPPHPFAGEDVPVPGHGFLPQYDVPSR
jgi:hypothetical protein